MHVKSIVDVLVFISVDTAIPVIATWFLPWERWIPKKIPEKIIGPYLLYCAFAVWYFKQSWWMVPMAGLGGIAVSAIAIFELRKARMMKQAEDWPVAEGRVLGTGQSRDADGIFTVTLPTHSKRTTNGLVLTSRSHSPVKMMRNRLSQDAENEH